MTNTTVELAKDLGLSKTAISKYANSKWSAHSNHTVPLEAIVYGLERDGTVPTFIANSIIGNTWQVGKYAMGFCAFFCQRDANGNNTKATADNYQIYIGSGTWRTVENCSSLTQKDLDDALEAGFEYATGKARQKLYVVRAPFKAGDDINDSIIIGKFGLHMKDTGAVFNYETIRTSKEFELFIPN